MMVICIQKDSRGGGWRSMGLDVGIGCGLGYYIQSKTWNAEYWRDVVLWVSNRLHLDLNWLMGAPAGFKLNNQFVALLGNGGILFVSVWKLVMDGLLAYYHVLQMVRIVEINV